ncbi:MAG: sigma 54-interacting transcriptional regulator [Deltaproteobacteria bacterium]
MSFDAETTRHVAPSSVHGGARLRLVFVGDDFVRTVDLTGTQPLRVGRGDGNDLVLTDSRLSRRHAQIERDPLRITDLGSANGVLIDGERIAPQQPTEFAPGAAVSLGGVMMLVQVVERPSERVLCTHAYFEARLDEEGRRRTRDRRTPFAVLAVRLEGKHSADVQRSLTSKLGPLDAVAAYAPNEYEILLLDAAPSRAEAVADELREDFARLDLVAHVGLASFPSDGLTAQTLIAAARASLEGRVVQEPAPVVVEDETMKALYTMVERVARGTITVLLTGETGAGKEVLAEALHAASPRRRGPMVRINCAALSESLVESELFGYVKGAFTGALQDKRGLIEAGAGGTVLLDEVGELPPATQAKLLRVLETGRLRRIGGIEDRAVDVRFVAATNRDLVAEIERGMFREDLYYRLSGVSLHVPPLRERPSEIAPLVDRFVVDACRELGVPPLVVDEDAMALLVEYRWPGNIRELKNTIDRAVLLADQRITVTQLPAEKMTAKWSTKPIDLPRTSNPERDAARKRIEDALQACAGNQTRAAEKLGVSRQTLANWLDRYGIPRPRRR